MTLKLNDVCELTFTSDNISVVAKCINIIKDTFIFSDIWTSDGEIERNWQYSLNSKDITLNKILYNQPSDLSYLQIHYPEYLI